LNTLPKPESPDKEEERKKEPLSKMSLKSNQFGMKQDAGE